MTDLVLQLLALVLSLVLKPQDASTPNTIVQIIQKGLRVYEQQTGAPLDPSLIKPEMPA